MSKGKQVTHDIRSPRRTFTPEFKQQAVRLITEEKYTYRVAAKSLGVGEQSLRQWNDVLRGNQLNNNYFQNFGQAALVRTTGTADVIDNL